MAARRTSALAAPSALPAAGAPSGPAQQNGRPPGGDTRGRGCLNSWPNQGSGAVRSSLLGPPGSSARWQKKNSFVAAGTGAFRAPTAALSFGSSRPSATRSTAIAWAGSRGLIPSADGPPKRSPAACGHAIGARHGSIVSSLDERLAKPAPASSHGRFQRRSSLCGACDRQIHPLDLTGRKLPRSTTRDRTVA